MNIKEELYIQQYKNFIQEYKENKQHAHLIFDPVTLNIKHDIYTLFDNIYTVICSHNKLLLRLNYNITKFDIQLITLSLYIMYYQADKRFMKKAIQDDKHILKKYKNLAKESNYHLDIILNKLLIK